eukprot:753656-Hanusia_phi.AAC.18
MKPVLNHKLQISWKGPTENLLPETCLRPQTTELKEHEENHHEFDVSSHRQELGQRHDEIFPTSFD